MPRAQPIPDSPIRRLRREQIESAALQSVLKHGFPGSSLRIVAKEAGVPLSILHYYFKDKDELMRAAVRRLFDENLARLAEAQARESDPIRRAEALLHSYVMRTTENWQATLANIEYWASCVRAGTVDRFYTQLHFRYRALLAGSLRDAGAGDPDALALALLGMMVGYSTFYRTKPPDPVERGRFLRFAYRMVRRECVRGPRKISVVRRSRIGIRR